LRTRVLELHRDSITAGHFGIKKTSELILRNFWWPKLLSDVTKFIKSCEICCRNNIPRHKPYGLLSPLSTPKRPWSDISIDFIFELPKSKDFTCIIVVVDRLTKIAHFIPFRCLLTSSIASDAFLLFFAYMVCQNLLSLTVVLNLFPPFGIDYIIFTTLNIQPLTILKPMVKRRG